MVKLIHYINEIWGKKSWKRGGYMNAVQESSKSRKNDFSQIAFFSMSIVMFILYIIYNFIFLNLAFLLLGIYLLNRGIYKSKAKLVKTKSDYYQIGTSLLVIIIAVVGSIYYLIK